MKKTFRVYRNGKRVGLLKLVGNTVTWVYVSVKHRRQGVATELYEQAKAYCAERNLLLESDVKLFAGARAYWEKQVKLGKAEKFAYKNGYKYRVLSGR